MSLQFPLPKPEAIEDLTMPFYDEPQNLIDNFYTGIITEIDKTHKTCLIDFGNYLGTLPLNHLNYRVPTIAYLGKKIVVKIKKWDEINQQFICNRKQLLYKIYPFIKDNIKLLYYKRVTGVVFYIDEENKTSLIDIGGGYLANICNKDTEGSNLSIGDLRDDYLIVPNENGTIRLSLKKKNHIGEAIQVQITSLKDGITAKSTYFGYVGKIVKTYKNFSFEVGDKLQVYITDYDENNFLEFFSI